MRFARPAAEYTPRRRTGREGASVPGARFLCDEMLARLGRYLRAAGYDTDIGEAAEPDAALLARAIAEDRIVLSCDRALLGRRGASGRVMILPHNGLDSAAQALGDRLPLDWMAAPFTRCLVDNTPLRRATEAQRAALPERARAAGGPVRRCPACGRLYWPGSHVRRMAATLARWQAAAGSDAGSDSGAHRGC